MLVQFAIQDEAVNDSASPAHIIRLLDRWQRFGMLVYPRRGDPALAKAIAALAPAPRKHWTMAWEKAIKNNGNSYRWIPNDGISFDWDQVDSSDSLAVFESEFEVAILEDTRAFDLDIPNGESRYFGQVEGIRLWDIDVSARFSNSEMLSTTAISVGEAIGDVWTERFQRIAKFSREAIIVDQYATRDNNISGLFRLFNFLDRDAKRCRVTIYSSIDPSSKGAKVTEGKIRSQVARLNGNGIKLVQVLLFQEADFRKYAHDRHIRFDGSVFRIGRGLRIFERPKVRESTDVDMIILHTGTREQKEVDLLSFGTQIHQFRIVVV